MQKVIYINQIQEYSKYIDQYVIDYIKEGQIETYESFDSFSFIAFDWYDIYNSEAEPSQIMIYMDDEDLFFICENEAAYNAANKYYTKFTSNERSLYQFFSNLLKGNTKYLEQIEDKISVLDDSIIDGKSEGTREEIVDLRYVILRLKKYYEQLNFIFEELCDNDNDLISKESLKYFEILRNRAFRLASSVMNLREYITQVRESYQAQIDIEQNNLMKVFTMVTSIFLPLTLIVGWYGMNFSMPELEWKFGYLAVVILSVLVCIIWYIIFKKKKWFD